jgi:hypothetical protein
MMLTLTTQLLSFLDSKKVLANQTTNELNSKPTHRLKNQPINELINWKTIQPTQPMN